MCNVLAEDSLHTPHSHDVEVVLDSFLLTDRTLNRVTLYEVRTTNTVTLRFYQAYYDYKKTIAIIKKINYRILTVTVRGKVE